MKPFKKMLTSQLAFYVLFSYQERKKLNFYQYIYQMIVRQRASKKLYPLKKLVEDWRQKKFDAGISGKTYHNKIYS